MRGHPAVRGQRAREPRQEVVAGGQHLYAAGQSRGRHLRLWINGEMEMEIVMGSLAVSRRAAAETADQPATSIADEVASIARKELAPLAAAIDSGEVYPDELLRRLRRAAAWGSPVPQDGESA